MQKLEIYDQFKKRFGQQLNPALLSVKYCQSESKAVIELYFKSDSTPIIINLDFMGGKVIVDQDGINNDILPLFEPKDDVIDNAKRLIELDSYSLIICIDGLLLEKVANKINTNYKKNSRLTKNRKRLVI
jgi:hypothetical protein